MGRAVNLIDRQDFVTLVEGVDDLLLHIAKVREEGPGVQVTLWDEHGDHRLLEIWNHKGTLMMKWRKVRRSSTGTEEEAHVCPICLTDDIGKRMVTRSCCNSYFCGDCLRKAEGAGHERCPCCRQQGEIEVYVEDDLDELLTDDEGEEGSLSDEEEESEAQDAVMGLVADAVMEGEAVSVAALFHRLWGSEYVWPNSQESVYYRRNSSHWERLDDTGVILKLLTSEIKPLVKTWIQQWTGEETVKSEAELLVKKLGATGFRKDVVTEIAVMCSDINFRPTRSVNSQ